LAWWLPVHQLKVVHALVAVDADADAEVVADAVAAEVVAAKVFVLRPLEVASALLPRVFLQCSFDLKII
jgi:hypothetical protein